jgi:hypothetical protein
MTLQLPRYSLQRKLSRFLSLCYPGQTEVCGWGMGPEVCVEDSVLQPSYCTHSSSPSESLVYVSHAYSCGTCK